MRVKKGDQVLVISGDDRGKKGKILKMFPKRGRVVVEGINFIKRHTRPSQRVPQGGILQREAPIGLSNVMLICPKCGTPTRFRSKTIAEGKRYRSCIHCGEVIE